MSTIEKNFYEQCKKYNDSKNNDYKGFLLYKAFKAQKFNEELLASLVMPKPKFDSIYGILITKTRIIEINAYSTMYIVSTKSYKNINKVVVEQEFDDKKVKQIIKDEEYPDKIQLKLQIVDLKNELEELVWENIENKDNIINLIKFIDKVREIQKDSNNKE